jgi:hypothetical protein
VLEAFAIEAEFFQDVCQRLVVKTVTEYKQGAFVGSASLLCSSIDQASWNWTLVVDLSEESGKSGWEEVRGRRSGCEVGWVFFWGEKWKQLVITVGRVERQFTAERTRRVCVCLVIVMCMVPTRSRGGI